MTKSLGCLYSELLYNVYTSTVWPQKDQRRMAMYADGAVNVTSVATYGFYVRCEDSDTANLVLQRIKEFNEKNDVSFKAHTLLIGGTLIRGMLKCNRENSDERVFKRFIRGLNKLQTVQEVGFCSEVVAAVKDFFEKSHVSKEELEYAA